MSSGIGASAFKIYEDENTVKYAYDCYHLGKPEHRNEERIRDGEISISKEFFLMPEFQGVKELIQRRK